MDPSIDGEIARISARIRRWREDAGLTLQELAKRSGLATSTVQKVETGQMTLTPRQLLLNYLERIGTKGKARREDLRDTSHIGCLNRKF